MEAPAPLSLPPHQGSQDRTPSHPFQRTHPSPSLSTTGGQPRRKHTSASGTRSEAMGWARGNKYDAVNTHHRTPIMDGVSLFESYIIDRERGVMPPKGFEEVADGSWFVSYLVDNDDVWARVKEEHPYSFISESTEAHRGSYFSRGTTWKNPTPPASTSHLLQRITGNRL